MADRRCNAADSVNEYAKISVYCVSASEKYAMEAAADRGEQHYTDLSLQAYKLAAAAWANYRLHDKLRSTDLYSRAITIMIGVLGSSDNGYPNAPRVDQYSRRIETICPR